MSFLNKIFNKSDDNEKALVDWKPLNNIDQLEEIKSDSFNKAVLIFKHSTRCGISRFALKNFESNFDIELEKMDSYILDLLSYRNISAAIAEIFSIQHQSPQAILISKGEVIYHDSHSSISVGKIKELLSE